MNGVLVLIDRPGKLENENNSWGEKCEILPMLGCGTNIWEERLYCMSVRLMMRLVMDYTWSLDTKGLCLIVV